MDIRLPKEVWEYNAMVGLEELWCDVAAFYNDILSYIKEYKACDGKVKDSTISVLMQIEHLTVQQAFDQTGKLASQRISEASPLETKVLKDVRRDAFVSAELRRWLKALRSTAAANLWFMYRSKRYFKNLQKVRSSLKVEISL